MYAAAFQPEYANTTYISDVAYDLAPSQLATWSRTAGTDAKWSQPPVPTAKPVTMNTTIRATLIAVNPAWTRPPIRVSNACSAVMPTINAPASGFSTPATRARAC